MYSLTSIYTHIHTYTHTYTHTYIHTRMHACMHTYIHAYIHPSIHIYIYTGWWFGTFFIFQNIWDNPFHWLIFFRGVETTNQYIYIHTIWKKICTQCLFISMRLKQYGYVLKQLGHSSLCPAMWSRCHVQRSRCDGGRGWLLGIFTNIWGWILHWTSPPAQFYWNSPKSVTWTDHFTGSPPFGFRFTVENPVVPPCRWSNGFPGQLQRKGAPVALLDHFKDEAEVRAVACYTAIRGQNGFPARFRLNHPLKNPDCSSLSVISQKELVCLNGLTFSIFQPWSTLSVMRAVVKTWPQKVFLQLIEVIMCVYIYIYIYYIHTHTYINASPVLNVPIIKNPW